MSVDLIRALDEMIQPLRVEERELMNELSEKQARLRSIQAQLKDLFESRDALVTAAQDAAGAPHAGASSDWYTSEINERQKPMSAPRPGSFDANNPSPWDIAAIRKLAERMHDIECRWDHTDQCSWGYEIGWTASHPSAVGSKTTWSKGTTHARWSEKAAKAVEASGFAPEVFLREYQKIHGTG